MVFENQRKRIALLRESNYPRDWVKADLLEMEIEETRASWWGDDLE